MLCFTSSDKLPDIQKTIFGFPTDKVAHFLMFLPFPILFYMAWDHDTSKALRSIGFNLLNLGFDTHVKKTGLPQVCFSRHTISSPSAVAR